MKLSLSPLDRIGPAGRPASAPAGRAAPVVVYGVVVPLTLAVAAAAGWYIFTGETPLDAWNGLASPPKIEMSMPSRPGGEPPDNALLQPPGATPDIAKAEAPKGEAPKAEAPKSEPPKAVAATGDAASADKLPSVTLPGAPAAEGGDGKGAPPPPAISEPLIPPGGDMLAPPSFAQLPARTDLKALPGGPSNDLLRNSADGPLPVVSGSRQARTAYARPFAAEGGNPKVAVVVTDLGLSREATEAAIMKLPPEVSLSFSPYAGNLDNWIKRARASGHEVLLDLPLEPPNYPIHDAGPLSILTRFGPAEAVAHLDAVLARATSYVGVAATLRSPVAAKDLWSPLLRDLKNRGLLFVGDGLVGVAEADMPASLSVSLVADETPFRQAIDTRLARLAAAAQRDGTALAYVSARPVTMERLLAWFASLPQKGMTLAPVSAVVRAPKGA